MKVYIYERGVSDIAIKCERALLELGCDIRSGNDLHGSDIAIAPWLNKRIPDAELNSFKYGALIFHPSILPMYRGRRAIVDAFKAGEKYTGVTWFWASSGLDMGDICEQAVCEVSGTPRSLYEDVIIPLGVSLLTHAMNDILSGHIRRRKQALINI